MLILKNNQSLQKMLCTVNKFIVQQKTGCSDINPDRSVAIGSFRIKDINRVNISINPYQGKALFYYIQNNFYISFFYSHSSQ